VSSAGFNRTRAGAAAAAIAAAALVLTAATGIVSVVSRGGFFTAPDWQILLTLVAGFLCGACATAAIRLLERRLLDPIGWIAAIVAPVSFAIIAVGIWWLHGWLRHGDLLGKLVATSLVALVSTLVVATLRLVARPRSRGAFALVVATVLCVLGVDALALAKIWSVAPVEGDTASATGSAGARLMLVLGILGVLAYLLTPLVDRLEPFLPRPPRPRRAEEPSGL
jgi:hypothetical protein